MPNCCPVCHANWPLERTCQTIQHDLLIFESQHAVPHSVHFLHVTCFQVQHELYSDEALRWASAMLRVHLNEHLTERQKLAALHPVPKEHVPRERNWKFKRAEDAPRLPEIQWELTIVDVAQHMQTAEEYCVWVKRWAWGTLRQMVAAYALDEEA